MTLPASPPTIAHGARCRRPAPVLQLSQRLTPILACPSCGQVSDLRLALDRGPR